MYTPLTPHTPQAALAQPQQPQPQRRPRLKPMQAKELQPTVTPPPKVEEELPPQ